MITEEEPHTIGIDLLQESFHISTNTEDPRNQFISNLLPTALLPLYPGEKGIYGLDALNHRRAKGWPHPNECRMIWNNENSGGCGRVPLAASMQRMIDFHQSDLQKSHLDRFDWQPLRCKQFLSASEIIIGSLLSIFPNVKSLIALPLPDSSNQNVQQTLINTFNCRSNSANNCGSKLFLLKRSIAQAMVWCKKNQKNFTLNALPIDKQHVGHLIVINVSMDFWEARLIPLCWHRWEDNYYLVPIESAYWPRESLQVSGWQLLTNWFHAEGIVNESLWQSLVGKGLLEDLLNNQLLSPLQWEKISQLKPTILPHSSELCASHIPKLSQIEQTLNKLQLRESELRSGITRNLGIIVDGCFSNWFKNLNLLSGMKVNNDSYTSISQRGHCSLAAQGAQLYSTNQLKNLPTFLEELIPICIWCRNSNRYGQEYIWRPLISSTTIPAGRSNKLENCPGFVLPAGQTEVQLILRRPSVDCREEYEYRKIPAKIFEKFSSNVNITISIDVKPGSGYAKASLLKDDGHLLSELNWKAMTKCEKPSGHQPAYLARTCEAICEDADWHTLAKKLKKLCLQDKLKKKNQLYQLEETLESIHDLFKSSRVKHHKNDCYLEYRVISSEGTVTSNNEQLELISQFLEVCYLLAGRQNEKEIKKRALQVMRHLFSAVSAKSRHALMKKLEVPNEITMQELLCLGHTFNENIEIIRFFEAFLAFEHTEIFYWLRALRAIFRYRFQVFDPDVINDYLYEALWKYVVNKLLINVNRPKILSSILQCLIYMLGRRRFDKNFIGLQSKLNDDLNFAIIKLKEKKIKFKILEQLEKLLNCSASESDIMILLSTEVSNDF